MYETPYMLCEFLENNGLKLPYIFDDIEAFVKGHYNEISKILFPKQLQNVLGLTDKLYAEFIYNFIIEYKDDRFCVLDIEEWKRQVILHAGRIHKKRTNMNELVDLFNDLWYMLCD